MEENHQDKWRFSDLIEDDDMKEDFSYKKKIKESWSKQEIKEEVKLQKSVKKKNKNWNPSKVKRLEEIELQD